MTSDITEPLKEHLLNRTWTLWFDTPILHNNYKETTDPIVWKQNIDRVYTFDTIEGFWDLYDMIIEPDEMCYKSAYYLFTYGTAPHCFDLNNQNGATIHYAIPLHTDINNAWLQIILTMIGENIKYSKHINGASIKKHKNCYELVVWLNIDDEKINNLIQAHFIAIYEKHEIELINTYLMSFDDKFVKT